MRPLRRLDFSSFVVLLLATGATASTFALVPTTPTSAASSNHAHDHRDHPADGLPPLDGTTEATLERFLAIDPGVLAGAHDHDHGSATAAADTSDCPTKRNGGVRGPGSPAG